MRAVTPELLQEVTRRLVAALNPEEIILFGSYAWGTPHEQSDLDLFIIVPDDIPTFDRVEWGVKALEAIDDLPVPFDVLVRPRSVADRASLVSASLAGKIREQGKVLYEFGKTKADQALANQGLSGYFRSQEAC